MSTENDKEQPKLRWGELQEDEDLDFLLQPKQIFGPDNDSGVNNIIQFKFNDDDNIKFTTNCRIRKLVQNYLSEKEYERSWPKIGDSVTEDVGTSLPMVSTEEILPERPTPLGAKQEDAKAASDNPFGEGGAVMICRPCGGIGDHSTSSCPYNYLAQREILPEMPPTDGPGQPDGLRAGAERPLAGMRRRIEQHSVRVTNLSEDTGEEELRELFRPYGQMNRVYVAIDCRSGKSRGFGFVNFANMEDAERAINELNGYDHDNLILRVEWAIP